MIRSSTLLSRTVLTTLVGAPIGIMAILSVTVLLPTLKNPESKFYSSKIGYPALQRLAGKPIKVQIVPVELKSLENSLAAPGESVALQEVGVRSLLSGRVEKVYVVDGQKVHRGQPLLQIEQLPFQNAVNDARNNVATSEVALETLKKSAPKQLMQLEADVESGRRKLLIAKTKLQQINSLVEGEQKDNVENAEARLAIAATKLQQLNYLVNEGAIAKFQLYDSQDSYKTRQRELILAKKGTIDTQVQLYGSQDLYTTLQNQLFSAQQRLALTQNQLEEQITQASLKLKNDKIALQNALRDLNNTVIYASNNGLISQVDVHTGEVADARSRDSLLTLTQNVVFKAYIDQARLNTIKLGDHATVRLIAYVGRSYSGRVIRLNPTVETDATKPNKVGIDRQYTYSVWVAVDGLQMPPGLQGYVQFDQGKTSLVLPENAVTHLSGGDGLVMVAESGRAVIKKVKLGRIFDNQREVLGGLKPGENVVVSPRALNPGDRLDTQVAQG